MLSTRLSSSLITLTMLAGSIAGAQTLTVGMDADVVRLDPVLSAAAVDRHVLYQVFDRLVDVDENLKIVPSVARSWKISSNGLTYTLTLRSGIKFHDGTSLNAAAVKYSLERSLNMDGSARKNELSAIKSITAVNPTTVRIDLHAPFGPLLAILSDRAGMIVSPTAAAKSGADFGRAPVGSGPFSFVSRTQQDNITLNSYSEYWNGAPKIDKLVYRPFPDGDVRYANLLSGGAQVIVVDAKDVEKLESNNKFNVISIPTLGFQGIWLNTTRAPFNNKLVRQAVAATIDRNAVAQVVFRNTAKPAAGPFPPNTPAYSSSIKVPTPNIADARKKLKQAGVSNLTFTMIAATGTTTALLTQVYQAMMAEAGINMKIELVDNGALSSRATSFNFDAALLNWSGRIDPDGNIYDWVRTGGTYNYGRYSNKEVDALLAKARAQSSMSARKATYNVALGKVLSDTPYIWVYHQSNMYGTTKAVSGLKSIPDGILRFKDVVLK
ncbi:ABC transporter substrate-binding protein [Deinococcus deserti]|uniref:Putative dipeptide ABC transporter, periplasmic component n=1 Tax=Deinococcus deserti (strain DSM 17065 / CIP 109153 / LMG 22923 / VCD115) TaxID=546414 RepID=C1D3C6_DEIDV|nr:ABC transporter substrate-binding protein [Deinococcus deserti]ACO48005.1 putative dipeptide ABC transporter, periplasmic component [Deinococcus deserti VCD115]